MGSNKQTEKTLGGFEQVILRCYKSTCQGGAGLPPAVVDNRSLGETWTLVSEVLGFCAFGAEDA